MDGERRRRVAERFAMDDMPCGRATGAPGTASKDGTRSRAERYRSPRRTQEEHSGRRPPWR